VREETVEGPGQGVPAALQHLVVNAVRPRALLGPESVEGSMHLLEADALVEYVMRLFLIIIIIISKVNTAYRGPRWGSA